MATGNPKMILSGGAELLCGNADALASCEIFGSVDARVRHFGSHHHRTDVSGQEQYVMLTLESMLWERLTTERCSGIEHYLGLVSTSSKITMIRRELSLIMFQYALKDKCGYEIEKYRQMDEKPSLGLDATDLQKIKDDTHEAMRQQMIVRSHHDYLSDSITYYGAVSFESLVVSFPKVQKQLFSYNWVDSIQISTNFFQPVDLTDDVPQAHVNAKYALELTTAGYIAMKSYFREWQMQRRDITRPTCVYYYDSRIVYFFTKKSAFAYKMGMVNTNMFDMTELEPK